MYARFDIKVLSQTLGIVLDYTIVRAGNLDNIIINVTKTVAWFASPGKVKRFSWDTLASCAVTAAYTCLQVPVKFSLRGVISYMPKRCTYEKNQKRMQLTLEYKSSKSSCCTVSSSLK